MKSFKQFLIENEETTPPIPELGNVPELEGVYNWDGMEYRFRFPWDKIKFPGEADEELEQQEEEARKRIIFLNNYYERFKEWYRREYPGDNDPDRLQRAWEAMQKDIERLINHGYTRHEIDKFYYIHTDGKHNTNYEDFPDWYHKNNEQVYGHNKDDWDIVIRSLRRFR